MPSVVMKMRKQVKWMTMIKMIWWCFYALGENPGENWCFIIENKNVEVCRIFVLFGRIIRARMEVYFRWFEICLAEEILGERRKNKTTRGILILDPICHGGQGSVLKVITYKCSLHYLLLLFSSYRLCVIFSILISVSFSVFNSLNVLKIHTITVAFILFHFASGSLVLLFPNSCILFTLVSHSGDLFIFCFLNGLAREGITLGRVAMRGLQLH